MDAVEKAIQPMRPALKIAAYIIFALAALKLAGVSIGNIPATWWQMAIGGLVIKTL